MRWLGESGASGAKAFGLTKDQWRTRRLLRISLCAVRPSVPSLVEGAPAGLGDPGPAIPDDCNVLHAISSLASFDFPTGTLALTEAACT